MASDSIHEAFATWTDAWNRRDIDTYLDAYTENARYVTPTGVLKGKEQIERHMRSRGIAGQLSTHSMEIELMGSNNALVFAWYLLKISDGTSHEGVFTVHVERQHGWKIVSDHSSAVTQNKSS